VKDKKIGVVLIVLACVGLMIYGIVNANEQATIVGAMGLVTIGLLTITLGGE